MSSVTIPNSFSASTKILSALVNANFTTLANFINATCMKNDAAQTITATTTQLTLAYDGSHTATLTVSSAGLLAVNATTTVTITPATTITGALTCSAAASVAGLLTATAGVAFSGADTVAYALYRLGGGTNNPGVFIKATEATSRTELYGSGSGGALDLWLGAGGVSGILKLTASAATFTTPLAITGALTGATTGAFSGAVSMGGALTGVTTLATSGAINGQTISASANFTGTIAAAGAISTTVISNNAAAPPFSWKDSGATKVQGFISGAVGSFDAIVDGAGAIAAARFDSSSTATETRLLLWDVTAAGLVRVTRGAADSGGSGFRLLRIPN